MGFPFSFVFYGGNNRTDASDDTFAGSMFRTTDFGCADSDQLLPSSVKLLYFKGYHIDSGLRFRFYCGGISCDNFGVEFVCFG